MEEKKIFSKDYIEKFLADTKAILNKPDFKPERDIDFIKIRAKDDPDDDYTNKNTMLALDLDLYSIADELNSLTVRDYLESVFDTVTNDGKYLHVFGRVIESRDIYIKFRLKIYKDGLRYIFCLSFHFARHDFPVFPYK